MHLGKYLFTQHPRRLQYPERDALPIFDYIDALGEHPHAKRKLEYAGPALPAEDELWPLVSNKNRFLADQMNRRLCVTVEGGVGKTKLLEELEATVAYDHPDQMVLRCELRELPTKADFFLDSGDFFLVRCAEDEIAGRRHDLQVHGLKVPDTHAVRAVVQAAARAGLLTLIVDAFDQLDKQGAFDRAKALKQFLSRDYYPRIRCIIAGRPYAIKRVWDALHLGELHSLEGQANGGAVRAQKPVWEFCKLLKFDADQVKEYLSGVSDGADKLAALKRMDAEEIHLPRTLNIIRELTAGELREMQTAADLYWHAMNKTIIDNFRRARTEYQLQYLRVEHVRPIVAAVAFAMMLWKDESVVEVPSVQTDKARDFFRFMKRAGFIAVLMDVGIEFDNALLDLAQVDSESIQFHFYSESPAREAPAEICDIRMSDATIRDFFAAHWAARYLKPQIEWLESQKTAAGLSTIDLELRLRDNVNSDDFKRFWQLLVGMPNESPVTHEEAATEASWTAAVASLFEVRESRPTELMYRCWPDLLWRAGFMEFRDHDDRPNWNTTPMAVGTRDAQREAKRQFDSDMNPVDRNTAKQLVVSFLDDYLSQCKSQELACLADPNVTPAMRSRFYLDCDITLVDSKNAQLRSEKFENEHKANLAYMNEHYPLWLLERSFGVVEETTARSRSNRDQVTTANLVHRVSFAINAYCVKNAMYSCFDRAHTSDVQSLVSYSWCEPLMFAIWAHGRLPDELQWEIAAQGYILLEHHKGESERSSPYITRLAKLRHSSSGVSDRRPYDYREWVASVSETNGPFVRCNVFGSFSLLIDPTIGDYTVRCRVSRDCRS